MANRVEEILDVGFQDPYVAVAALLEESIDRVMHAAPRTIGKTCGGKAAGNDGFQYQSQGLLHDAVADRGNTQPASAAGELGNERPPHRQETVAAAAQLAFDLAQAGIGIDGKLI